MNMTLNEIFDRYNKKTFILGSKGNLGKGLVKVFRRILINKKYLSTRYFLVCGPDGTRTRNQCALNTLHYRFVLQAHFHTFLV